MSGPRFHVDAWDPSYGSGVEGVQAQGITPTTATVETGVEVATTDWAPIGRRPSVVEPSAVLFVDGVRRIEARLWLETSDPTGEAVMALAASYGAGVVCSCPSRGAHLLQPRIQRALVSTATDSRDLPTAAGTYRRVPVQPDPTKTTPTLLSDALQRKLSELEGLVASQARSAADGHAGEHDLLVIDGPLRGRERLPRAVGYIKSHHTAYLPPPLQAQVARLRAGQRTPVFRMGTTWDRHSWYLRLPGRPAEPWAGVVRVECAADLSLPDVVSIANQTQLALPRYASIAYKDTRAPQNLVPVAGLERDLRRRLGHPTLLLRALQTAARG